MKKPIFPGQVINCEIVVTENEPYHIWLGSLEGQSVEISVNKKTDSRTASQNNALHLYFERVSEALNDAGLTIEKVIENFTMEHEWSAGTVKELLWREAQRFATQKESTIELNKLQEIEKVYDIVNRFLAKLKIESIPFPSLENLEIK